MDRLWGQQGWGQGYPMCSAPPRSRPTSDVIRSIATLFSFSRVVSRVSSFCGLRLCEGSEKLLCPWPRVGPTVCSTFSVLVDNPITVGSLTLLRSENLTRIQTGLWTWSLASWCSRPTNQVCSTGVCTELSRLSQLLVFEMRVSSCPIDGLECCPCPSLLSS